jgi:hypothetical protein
MGGQINCTRALKSLDDKIIAMFTAQGLDPYKVMMRMRDMIPTGE